jgi:3-methyl-2-oxobutanoate hydroxymethyltransferase
MSARPQASHAPPAKGKPVTLSKLAEKKALGEPIVMVTAYDYPSAQVAEAAGVDMVLVGDSGAMVVLGYPSTVPVSVDEMLVLTSAARRGLTSPMLVGDLPFGSYERSNEQAIETAQRFVKEAGCDAVKLERGGSSVERAAAIVAAGIPVIVFEAVPSELTAAIMPRIEIPVIGIGAGPSTDGQVLVFHDLLGIYDGHAARFVKRYGNVRAEMVRGVEAYAADVRERRYPEPEHGYTMAPDEAARLKQLLAHT